MDIHGEVNPLTEIEKHLRLLRSHEEERKKAVQEGNAEAMRVLESQVTKVYFDLHPTLLKLALASITAFTVLKAGLVMPTARDEETKRIQYECMAMLLGAMSGMMPPGMDLAALAVGGQGKGDVIEPQ